VGEPWFLRCGRALDFEVWERLGILGVGETCNFEVWESLGF